MGIDYLSTPLYLVRAVCVRYTLAPDTRYLCETFQMRSDFQQHTAFCTSDLEGEDFLEGQVSTFATSIHTASSRGRGCELKFTTNRRI